MGGRRWTSQGRTLNLLVEGSIPSGLTTSRQGSKQLALNSSAKRLRPSASPEHGRFVPGSPKFLSKTRDSGPSHVEVQLA